MTSTAKITPKIDARCTRCGACLEECPSQAILSAFPHYVIDPDLCEGSQLCIPTCPEQAIQSGGARK